MIMRRLGPRIVFNVVYDHESQVRVFVEYMVSNFSIRATVFVYKSVVTGQRCQLPFYDFARLWPFVQAYGVTTVLNELLKFACHYYRSPYSFYSGFDCTPETRESLSLCRVTLLRPGGLLQWVLPVEKILCGAGGLFLC